MYKIVAIAILASCPLLTTARGALPVKFEFQGTRAEHTWPLAELGADLPSDWSPFDFLVLELKASSTQRFELGLETDRGRIAKRIHPLPNVWVRASIPLRFYRQPAGDGVDLAATFNQPRSSYWINIHTNEFGPTTDVRGISVMMPYPAGGPTLEIRSIKLAKEDPGDDVLEGKPIIDELGQYAHADWPGKARTLDDLKASWAAEAAALESHQSDRCLYGGFAHTTARATGFFRVEQIDGRWWFVCPDGHLFFSTGSNGVGTNSGTRVRGREDLFAALPPTDAARGEQAGRSERGGRGRGRGNRGGGSMYTWNVQRRYGDDWRIKWADLTTKRMTAWGFNSMHNWGAPNRNQPEPKIPYAMMMRGWQTGRSIMGMPDVYAPDFPSRIDETAASQLTSFRDDPYMLGFFIGNEPPWPGRESQLCDAILAGDETEIQKRLKTHLAEGDTPARRKAFVIAAFQVYLDTINAAVKKHDPNHLNLGIRFGGDPDEEVLKSARGFDVFSQNIYSYAPRREQLDRPYALLNKPILFGEFHIGVPGRGLAPGLVQAMNQQERANGYRYYVEQVAAHPAVIGTHWFQWLDQPATGRNDGENYNIGFVDVTDRPYEELVVAAKTTHARLCDVHSGKTPPFDRRPKANEVDTRGDRK
jgi:hypothetical protein